MNSECQWGVYRDTSHVFYGLRVFLKKCISLDPFNFWRGRVARHQPAHGAHDGNIDRITHMAGVIVVLPSLARRVLSLVHRLTELEHLLLPAPPLQQPRHHRQRVFRLNRSSRVR